MPTVPGKPGQVIPFPAQQKIDPTYLLMAAATMHEQGRLFEKPTEPKALDVNTDQSQSTSPV